MTSDPKDVRLTVRMTEQGQADIEAIRAHFATEHHVEIARSDAIRLCISRRAQGLRERETGR